MTGGFSRLRHILFGVLASLAATGALWLIVNRPRGQPVELLPPAPTASPAPLRVHVSGEVAAPGVVSLPPGSTVQDAIRAAGGATARADLERLNLAAPISDGQQVFVPDVDSAGTPSGGASLSAGPTPQPGTTININRATADELEALPGIGEVIAARIVEYRTTNGPYRSIEEIIEVDGIGPAKFEAIRALISVGP